MADARTAAFAAAYRDAALAGGDMRAVADALETARERLASDEHFLDAFEAVDDLVGDAWGRPELEAAQALRDRLLSDYIDAEVDRLDDAEVQDPEVRWRAYVRLFARGLATWQLQVCERLLEVDPGSAAPSDELETLRRGGRRIVQERWAEAYPAFVYLAGADPVPDGDRARIAALCGAIQIYHLDEEGKAEAHLNRAEELAPDEAVVFEVRGDLHLERDELELAKRCLDRALSLDPMSAGAHCSMGDLAEKKDELSEAEWWYLEAVRRHPGSSSGYKRLFRLYGRPDAPGPEDERRIPELVDRVVSVDPMGTYGTYVEVGWAYLNRGRSDTALEWFQRAIDLDPRGPTGHAAHGHALLRTGDVEGARAAFARATEVAPDAFDGHWGLAVLEEQVQDWEEAERRFREAMRFRPGWRNTLASRAAYAAWRQGRRDEAVQELLDTLRDEPESTAVRTTVERIADETQSVLDDLPGALRLYEEIAGVLGPDYEERHRGRVEALHEAAAVRENSRANALYSAGAYAAAIPLYDAAIELDPQDAVYHSNLASAWQMNREAEPQERLERAVEALTRAAALDPSDDSYRDRLDRLRTLAELVPVFGGAALDRIPVVSPLAVEVGRTLTPLFEGEGSGLSELAQAVVEAMRSRVLERFGVPVPGVRVHGNEDPDELAPGSFVVLLMEVPLATGSIDEAVDEPGAEGWQQRALEHVVAELEAVIRRHLATFLGLQELDARLAAELPELRERIVARPGELARLVGVLRALLTEGVPAHPLGPLCERFERLRAGEVPLELIVEELRSLDETRERLPGNQESYTYYAVSDDFLDAFERSIHQDGPTRSLAMEPETCQEVLTAVRDVVGGPSPEALVIHRPALRPLVRRLLELEFPDLAVLASTELALPGEPVVAGTVVMAGEEEDAGNRVARDGPEAA